MRLLLAIGIAIAAVISGLLVAEIAFVGVNALYRGITSAETPEGLLLGTLYGGFVIAAVVVAVLGWRRLRRSRKVM